ncbi:PREDICTED: 28S ribosomal protein S17, mitochondrial [Dinoponera quadriceps]|uniref:28S ribosomal protein S17, mitochondrial n=1 Tax=Dinoponera quadriceps TaxID=609295 RepID=A0A6P3XN45_DINQU|nr:PREDICTED: 28S ribosomal protein S17, mitochondrial [Dinoponera quadriceps]
MAGKEASKVALRYLLGKCVPSSKQNAAKVRIPQLKFDNYFHMYFKEHEFVYANDPQKLCKTGDIILIKALPAKMTRLITHEVIEVIHPLGDITDPITGKKTVKSAYREDLDEIVQLHGRKETAYDYEKAPRRGRLENIRDFTHKKVYLKYYDNPDDPQPDTV